TATGLDLAMALGIFFGSEEGSGRLHSPLRDYFFAGELGLTGKLRPVSGILNLVSIAKAKGFLKIVLPFENSREASFISGLEIFPTRSLREVIEHLTGHRAITSFLSSKSRIFSNESPSPLGDMPAVDLKDVCGQQLAKQAILLSAAGGHNIL